MNSEILFEGKSTKGADYQLTIENNLMYVEVPSLGIKSNWVKDFILHDLKSRDVLRINKNGKSGFVHVTISDRKKMVEIIEGLIDPPAQPSISEMKAMNHDAYDRWMESEYASTRPFKPPYPQAW